MNNYKVTIKDTHDPLLGSRFLLRQLGMRLYRRGLVGNPKFKLHRPTSQAPVPESES